MECHGVPEFVIVGGRVCVDNGELKVVQGHGRFVETLPYAPYVYDKEAFGKMSIQKINEDENEQAIMNKKMEKMHVDDVSAPTLPDSEVSSPSCKGPRLEGQRNLQDSTFSISGMYYLRNVLMIYAFK